MMKSMFASVTVQYGVSLVVLYALHFVALYWKDGEKQFQASILQHMIFTQEVSQHSTLKRKPRKQRRS